MALENLENWKMVKKIPCMEQSWNLKNDEISWKNQEILLCLGVNGTHFFPCSLDKYIDK